MSSRPTRKDERQTRTRVLVVEDDEAMAVALRDGFRYEGFDVTVARDGESGMHLATSTSPDLARLMRPETLAVLTGPVPHAIPMPGRCSAEQADIA